MPSESYSKLNSQQGKGYKTSPIFLYLSLVLALVLLLQSSVFAWMWLAHSGHTCSDAHRNVIAKESKLKSMLSDDIVREGTQTQDSEHRDGLVS